MNIQDVRLAVVGLGYVGLPLAVEFGKQREVLGFDINARRIEELRAGNDHTLEVSGPELAEARHLRYSSDPAELASANVGMVLYPLSAFRAMNKAAETVYQAIRRDGHQKNVVDMMQTRDELYDRIGYHEFESRLDALFQQGKSK